MSKKTKSNLRKLRLPRKLKKELKLCMQYHFGGKMEILTYAQIVHYFEIKLFLSHKYWREIKEFKNQVNKTLK